MLLGQFREASGNSASYRCIGRGTVGGSHGWFAIHTEMLKIRIEMDTEKAITAIHPPEILTLPEHLVSGCPSDASDFGSCQLVTSMGEVFLRASQRAQYPLMKEYTLNH